MDQNGEMENKLYDFRNIRVITDDCIFKDLNLMRLDGLNFVGVRQTLRTALKKKWSFQSQVILI